MARYVVTLTAEFTLEFESDSKPDEIGLAMSETARDYGVWSILQDSDWQDKLTGLTVRNADAGV